MLSPRQFERLETLVDRHNARSVRRELQELKQTVAELKAAKTGEVPHPAAPTPKPSQPKPTPTPAIPARPSVDLCQQIAQGITGLAGTLDRPTLLRLARALKKEPDAAAMGRLILNKVLVADQRTRLAARVAAQLETKGSTAEHAAEVAAKLATGTNTVDLDRYDFAARAAAKKNRPEPMLVARQGDDWQLIPASVPKSWKPKGQPGGRVTLLGLLAAAKVIAAEAVKATLKGGKPGYQRRVSSAATAALAQELTHALQQASQAGREIAGAVAEGFSMAVKTTPAARPPTGKPPGTVSAALRAAQSADRASEAENVGRDMS